MLRVNARIRPWHKFGLAAGLAAVAVYTLRGSLPSLSDVVAVLRSAEVLWVLAAAVAQLVSLDLFVRQHRSLLGSMGVPVPLGRVRAVTYAGSAISISMPAGAAVSAGFAFGQYRRSGVPGPVAAAAIGLSGLISITGLALLYVGGLLGVLMLQSALARSICIVVAICAVVLLAVAMVARGDRRPGAAPSFGAAAASPGMRCPGGRAAGPGARRRGVRASGLGPRRPGTRSGTRPAPAPRTVQAARAKHVLQTAHGPRVLRSPGAPQAAQALVKVARPVESIPEGAPSRAVVVRPSPSSRRWMGMADLWASARANARVAVRASASVSRPGWLVALAYATANWLADLLCLVAASRAFGLPVGVSTVAGIFLGVQIVRQIPLTPGGIGLVEAALIAGLTAAGGTAAAAAAVVLTYRLLSFWLVLPIGGLAWLRLREETSHTTNTPAEIIKVRLEPDALPR
jgi:uncharacterized membrane protein YbhN (UPF0104 family)